MARFYEKILGCRNEGIYRVFTLFGIKFRRKNTRVQLLTEIRALTAQCANLAASLKALSTSSLQRHENINTLLTKGLTEINSQLKELSEIAGANHQTTMRQLRETHSLLQSHGEKLEEFRAMQEEVNKQQGQNHQATAQKLDEANNHLKSHAEKLAEVHSTQGDVNKVQKQNHQETAQKLDAANNLLKAHGAMLAEFRTMQEETNKQQVRGHQETTQKLDAANSLLKSHGEALAEFRGMQEEVNKQQGQNHQATAQKLDEANNHLKSHAEKLAEVHSTQGDVNKVQKQNHQETAQKLDAANNLLKAHGAMLAEFRTMQEETNKQQVRGHQETTQKLDAANSLLKSHGEALAEFRGMQEEVNKQQGQNHQATAQKLDEANSHLKSHAEKLAEVHSTQGDVNKVQKQNHQETAQKLDEAIKLARTGAGKAGYLLELEYSSARYYQNAFERGFLIPMFDYMDRADFEEKYLALIHGMASPSIREINKILSRVAMVKASPDQARYNFYSVSEQDEKTKLRTDFDNQILRISDSLYAYDKYLLPVRHFEACVFLHKHGIDLIRDKESIRKKDIIDAGGFIGDSALVLSDYTDRKIYSFEANPRNFDLLQKTLEINHLSNVVPVQKALWSSETELELSMNGSGSSLYNLPSLVNEDNPPVSLPLVSPGRTVNGKKLTVGIFKVDREGEMHVQESGLSFTEVGGKTYVNETVRVPTVTLDRFVEKKGIRVGLIKVDLEGAELEFLKGAEHTIRTQKPVLLLSIYHQPSDFFELKPLLEQWVPEYEFSVFNPVDWGILIETMIVAQPRFESGIPLEHNPPRHRQNRAS